MSDKDKAAKTAQEAAKAAQDWLEMMRTLGAPIEKLYDDNMNKIMKMYMFNMMNPYSVNPYTDRYATNVNIKAPIDPDGQLLNLLSEIEKDVAELRKLILSRGRE